MNFQCIVDYRKRRVYLESSEDEDEELMDWEWENDF